MLSHSALAQKKWFFKSKQESLKIETDSSIIYIEINKKGDTLNIDEYVDGKRHGRSFERLARSENIQIDYYYHGFQHGPSILLNKKRKLLRRYNYYFGKLHAYCYTYYDGKKIKYARVYNHDTLKNETHYGEDGKVKNFKQFIDLEYKGKIYPRMLHGKQLQYFENGNRRESHFYKGFGTGVEKMLNTEGELIYESFMLNDSTRQYIHHREFNFDTSLVKFWKPFKHPFLKSKEVKIFAPYCITELEIKNNYNHRFKERYYRNGSLEYRMEPGTSYFHWPNGLLREIRKSQDRENWNKTSFDQNGNFAVKEIKRNSDRKQFEYKKTIEVNGDRIETFRFFNGEKSSVHYMFELINGQLSTENFWNYVHVQQKYNSDGEISSVSLKDTKDIKGYRQFNNKLKNTQGRLWGSKIHSKRNHQIHFSDYSFYSGKIKDGVYEIKYANGATKLKFELKDSLLIGDFYYALPNGQAICKYSSNLDSDESSRKVLQKLGYYNDSSDAADAYQTYTSSSLFGDTLLNTCFYYESLIYSNESLSRDESNIIKKSPLSGAFYDIKKYKNGKIKSIAERKSGQYEHYSKKGKVIRDVCRLNDQTNWKIHTLYFKNGFPQKRVEYNLEDRSLSQTLTFFRCGKLKSVTIEDSTKEYKKNGDLFAIGKTSRLSRNTYYTRVQKNKSVEFINGKRQFGSVNFLKALAKKVYVKSKRRLKIIYNTSKNWFKKIF